MSNAIGHIVTLFVFKCPRQDSNLRSRFRKPMLYPLSYGSRSPCSIPSTGCKNGNGTVLWYRLTRRTLCSQRELVA